jgi:hypothetical protein
MNFILIYTKYLVLPIDIGYFMNLNYNILVVEVDIFVT